MRLMPPWFQEVRVWAEWVKANGWELFSLWCGVIAIIMCIRILWSTKARRTTSRGSAMWATRREIRLAGLLVGGGVLVGEVGWWLWRDYLRVGGGRNVLVTGPTRVGKSSVVTVKTICSDDDESLWIFDLKGELVRLTLDYRKLVGPTYVFRPAATTSDRINPADLVRWGTPFDVADTQTFAEYIAQGEQQSPLQRPTSEEAQYYRRWARVLLVGVTLGLHDDPQKQWPCTMRGMLKFFSQSGTSVTKSLEWLKTSRDEIVQEVASLVLARTVNDQKEVFSAAAGWLFPWFDPVLAYNTDETTIPVDELQQGIDPMTLYFHLYPDDVQGRLRPVVRLLYAMIKTRVTRRPTRAYRRRVRCVFEDMAELGYFPLIENITAFDGEAGWCILAVTQSTNQVWQKYGHDTALFDNCDTWVVFQPNHPETAEFLVKKLGKMTVTETMSGRGRQPWSLFRSTFTREQVIDRPLLDPWELMHVGKKSCIVLVGTGADDESVKPIRAKARPYWKDRKFAGRVSV